MTITLQSPLVGAHFRPPAKQVLAHLAAGSLLVLVAEPENPYDEFAIKVMVDCASQLKASQADSLALALAGTGSDIMDIMEGFLHLGYIISANNKKLGNFASNIIVGEMMKLGEIKATLGFAADGGFLVNTRLVDEGPISPPNTY